MLQATNDASHIDWFESDLFSWFTTPILYSGFVKGLFAIPEHLVCLPRSTVISQG